MKNKKIIIAVCVLVFGVILISALKHTGHLLAKEIEYTCVAKSSDKQNNEFYIRYLGNKPSLIKMTTTLYGPEIKDNERSKERVFYEQEANSMYYLYNKYKKINGYTVRFDSTNITATGVLTIDYSAVNDKDIKNLFATKNETINKYIKRLEKAGYICKEKKTS